MKKEYNLGKLRKRPGKVKVDPDAAKTPISIRLNGADKWYIFGREVCIGQSLEKHPLVEELGPGKIAVFVNCGFTLHDPYYGELVDPCWQQIEQVKPLSYMAAGESCFTFVTEDDRLFETVLKRIW